MDARVGSRIAKSITRPARWASAVAEPMADRPLLIEGISRPVDCVPSIEEGWREATGCVFFAPFVVKPGSGAYRAGCAVRPIQGETNFTNLHELIQFGLIRAIRVSVNCRLPSGFRFALNPDCTARRPPSSEPRAATPTGRKLKQPICQNSALLGIVRVMKFLASRLTANPVIP